MGVGEAIRLYFLACVELDRGVGGWDFEFICIDAAAQSWIVSWRVVPLGSQPLGCGLQLRGQSRQIKLHSNLNLLNSSYIVN